MFVHSGAALSVTGGVGHGVEAVSSLTKADGPGEDLAGPSAQDVKAFLERKVWRGADSGAVMLLCSAAT